MSRKLRRLTMSNSNHKVSIKRKMTLLIVSVMLAISGAMPASAVDIHEDPPNSGPPVTEGGEPDPDALRDTTNTQPHIDSGMTEGLDGDDMEGDGDQEDPENKENQPPAEEGEEGDD